MKLEVQRELREIFKIGAAGGTLALASTVVPKTPAEDIFWFSVIFILSAGAVLAFIGFIRDKKAKAIVGLGLPVSLWPTKEETPWRC